MDEPIIRAENLRKVYALPGEQIAALQGVSVDVYQGDFIAIMGPSGSGKTTLLDILGCLDSLTSGSLTVLGHDLSHSKEKHLPNIRRKNIGFVFQDFFLIPTLTALENVELPLYFAKIPHNRERSVQLLKKVGMEHRINHLPKQMSGGEMQRVAIARALATSPKIVLADEPTGNLDTKKSHEIFSLFRTLNQEEGVTILVVTHDRKLGQQADRVIHLEDGKIVSEERGEH
jgi:putative ABC transport system ATP-binding protein